WGDRGPRHQRWLRLHDRTVDRVRAYPGDMQGGRVDRGRHFRQLGGWTRRPRAAVRPEGRPRPELDSSTPPHFWGGGPKGRRGRLAAHPAEELLDPDPVEASHDGMAAHSQH